MRTKEFKIEKTIPLPKKGWATLARKMRPNDSVLVDNHSEMDSLRGAIRKTGAKAKVKQFYPKYRVWKV